MKRENLHIFITAMVMLFFLGALLPKRCLSEEERTAIVDQYQKVMALQRECAKKIDKMGIDPDVILNEIDEVERGLEEAGVKDEVITKVLQEMTTLLSENLNREKVTEALLLTVLRKKKREILEPQQRFKKKKSLFAEAFKRLGADEIEEVGEGVLAEGDVIEIRVDKHKEFNIITAVRQDGMVSLNLLGDVEARGLTLKKFEKFLVKKLAEFIRRPKVTVITKRDLSVEGADVFSYFVFIFGEVLKPGGYSVSGRVNLMQLLALAGGFSKKREDTPVQIGADLKNIKIIRVSGKISYVNVKRFLKTGKGGEEIFLRPGDTVYVDSSLQRSVDILGAVVNPGSYALAQEEKIGLWEAISLAGGLIKEAAIHNIKVVQRLETGGFKTSEVNLKKDVLKKGKISTLPSLGAGDTVFVYYTKLYHWERFFKAIEDTAGAAKTLNAWSDLKVKLKSTESKDRETETINFYDEEGKIIESKTFSSGDLKAN